jgi:hypothetical protein
MTTLAGFEKCALREVKKRYISKRYFIDAAKKKIRNNHHFIFGGDTA